MKKAFILIGSLLLLFNFANAQFGRKVTVGGYAGLVVTTQNENRDELGNIQNIFGSYSPGFGFGGNIFFNPTKNISVGTRIKYLYLGKENFSINNFTIGLAGKFHFLPMDKFISPYLFAEGNFSLAGVKRAGETEEIDVDQETSEEEAQVTKIIREEPSISLSFVPLAGVAAGAGADLKIREYMSIFLQGEYNLSFARNKKVIDTYFDKHNGNLGFIFVSAGVKFDLFKQTSLY